MQKAFFFQHKNYNIAFLNWSKDLVLSEDCNCAILRFDAGVI